MPRVSVIMPSYNSDGYLQEAINSVLRQTFKDLELLIIDDGSTDNSLEIMKNNMRLDKRIRIFHTNNKGSSVARNLGLNEAKGEIICFIDSDDVFDPSFIEKGMSYIDKGYECVIYDYKRFNARDRTIYKTCATPFQCGIAVWNKLYIRKLWNNIYFPEGIRIEDFEVTPIVVGRAKKLVHIENVFYNYRIHLGSITHKSDLKEPLAAISAVEILMENQEKFNLSFDKDSLKKYINNFFYTHLFTCISRYPRKVDKKNAFLQITRYSHTFNKKYFNENTILIADSNLKQHRNNIMIWLFKHSQFKLGIFFVKTLSRCFGKKGVK